MSQQAEIEWRNDTVPISTRFDDPYFSLENGLAETKHVFLDGNGLPERFRDGFHVAELGFGTGLNLLATLNSWRQSGQTGQLNFTSFEAFPMASADMIAAQAAFPSLSDISAELAQHWQQGHVAFELPDLRFEMIEGDARSTLPNWPGKADAWFLDGFSPAKNPEMWEPELMVGIGVHTSPGGTVATYTAAGFVRRGLTEVGFEVTRRAGYGRKRHMSVATMPETP